MRISGWVEVAAVVSFGVCVLFAVWGYRYDVAHPTDGLRASNARATIAAATAAVASGTAESELAALERAASVAATAAASEEVGDVLP